MPTTVTSPYERFADEIKIVLDTEFTDLGVSAEHDNLHDSIGHDGGPRVGITPGFEEPLFGNQVVGNTYLLVKFFNHWDKEVNPEQSVDPRIAANQAERFRQACRNAEVVWDDNLWFFNISSIEYPDDPTGNKSRFVANVVAYSTNSQLNETTA